MTKILTQIQMLLVLFQDIGTDITWNLTTWENFVF